MSVRYGVKLRKKVEDVRRKQKQKYVCPRCGKKKVKRVDFAQWKCRACGVVFAGGAFEPQTGVGGSVKKILAEKTAQAGQS